MKTTIAVFLIVIGFGLFGVISNIIFVDADKPVVTSYQSCNDPLFESEVNKFNN